MQKKLIFLIITVLMLTVLTGCGLFSGMKKLEEGSGQQPGHSSPTRDQLLAKHIPNTILVKTTDQAELNKILQAYDGTLLRTIDKLDVHQLELGRLTENSLVATLEGIQEIARVEYAQPVYVYQPTLTLTDSEYYHSQWGPRAIGLDTALDLTTNQGYGVTIAIIDTGIDYNHPEIADRVLPGYNAFKKTIGYTDIMDTVGHGTHVAGIAAANINAGQMAGIAPRSEILPIKALGEGGGTDTSVVDGIIWAADNGAQVINMSLGGKGYSQAMQNAVDYALTKGVVMVAAMGNSGSNELLYPAGYSGVIAVGAANGRNQPGDFSTRGRHISVSAPGVDVYSSVPDGGYQIMNGTSMATPHVAGAVALLLAEKPGLTPTEVQSYLENSAIDMGTPGFDEETGYGMINLFNLLADSSVNKYGALQVQVTSYGQGVGAAEVLVSNSATGKMVKNLKTNANGIAFFHNLKAGSYTVTASSAGSSKTTSVTVVASESSTVTLSLIDPVVPATTLEGYLVDSRGGAGVASSSLTIRETSTNASYTLTTRTDGFFSQQLPAGTYEVTASKAGYAGSKYQSIQVPAEQVTQVTMMQRPVLSTNYGTTPPTIEAVGVNNGTIVAGTFSFDVSVSSVTPFKELQLRVGHLSLNPDQITSSSSGTLTVDTTQLADSDSFINLVAYDENDNLAEWTIPINVQNGENQGLVPAQIDYLDVYALTFGENMGYYRQHRANLFERLGKDGDPNIIQVRVDAEKRTKEFDITSAPADCSVLVELEWATTSDTVGYKIYRAVDQLGPYTQIADVRGTTYTDTSSVLTVGQPYYYKVAAYNESGEGVASEVNWTEPLPPFNLYLETPADWSTGISLQPTFTWSDTAPADTLVDINISLIESATNTVVWDEMFFWVDDQVSYVDDYLTTETEYFWDIYKASYFLYYEGGGYAVAIAGQDDGSANGPFTFTTATESTTPVYTSLLTTDLEELDGESEMIPLQVNTAGNYEFSTHFYLQDCDTVLELYDADYNQVAKDDDGGVDSYSLINVDLQPGDYYIKVTEYFYDPLYCTLEIGYWE